MKPSPSQKRYSLVFCLSLVALLGAFLCRPYAAVLAAHLPVAPSSRLVTLLNHLAGQDTPQRPTRQEQDPQTTRQRQTESRTVATGEGETKPTPCPLPDYYDKLSGAAQNALLTQMGCVPVPVVTTIEGARAGREPLPTLESALSNVPVNDPTADLTTRNTQSETGLVLAGPNIVSVFNDSGSFTANTSPGNHFTGFAVSMNGGTSFQDKGTLPNSTIGDAGDPVLARSASTGTVFISTLGFNSGNALQIFRSTDNGMTFGAPINGAPGFSTAHSLDKEWIAVDNTPGAGYGNVYMAAVDFTGSNGNIIFTRSTDDGFTWSPSGGTSIATGNFNQGAFVTVGADHAVYVYWLDQTALPKQIKVRKSTDQGVTFGPAVTVTSLLVTTTNGNLGLGFRTNAFPTVVANPIDPNKQYIVYNDNPAGADRGDIYFQQTNDGGATWTAPVRVNTDAGTNDQFVPSIAIKPDGSALAITWYDRRNDPANNLMERWGRVGTISGMTVTFGPDFVISDAPYAPIFGQDTVVNSVYMGDYDQMAADNTFFYTTFLDTRLGTQDVRFAKFTIAGPNMAIVKALPATLSGGNGDQVINPDECNMVTIPFTNNGTLTASNVTATLTTSTPGVIIFQPTSTYPDIAPGQTANNLTPFKVSTTAAFVCGTNVTLTLTINSSAGTDVINFTLPGQPPSYVLATMTGQTIDPGTTLVPGSQADDATVLITLPFSYQFYNQNFTTLRASTNGNLQFTSNNTAFTNACLPAGGLNNALLPFWDDLILTGGTNGIYTSVSGVAPNRIFNIEWRGTQFTGGGAVNFEVRLYEGQAKFDFIYGTVTGNGNTATVGVQRDTGSSFTQFSCNTASLSTGLKITGTLAPCTTGGGACVLPFSPPSDQKPGSLLVFPFYKHDAQNKVDTRLTITNIGKLPINVHFLFMDGATCTEFDQFVCFTPNASIEWKASQFDPQNKGYVIAYTVDNMGRPIAYNGLIGNGFVNDGEYVGNYSAESFNSPLLIGSPLGAVATPGLSWTIPFDGFVLDLVPSAFTVDIQSPVNTVNQKIVLAGLTGDAFAGKLSGVTQVGTGLAYNGHEALRSFSPFISGQCFVEKIIDSANPKVTGTLAGLIPKNEVGTLRFNVTAAVGLLMTSNKNTFGGIRTLHKVEVAKSSIIIPLVMPDCQYWIPQT